jgi:hypothetical protein
MGSEHHNAGASGMPNKAEHPVNCKKGGKHSPTTHEKLINGKHIKYSVCTKCKMIP